MLGMFKNHFGFHMMRVISIPALRKRSKRYPSIVRRMAIHILSQVTTKL